MATLEFSRDRKSMSILVKNKKGGKNIMFIKGAPDYLLERTNKIVNNKGEVVSMSSSDKARVLDEVKNLAEKGLRTLAICVQEDCG